MAGDAWIAIAGIEFVGLFFLTAWLVRFYAAKGTHWSALVFVFISWYLGLFGTLFLPIDIAEAYHSVYPATLNVTMSTPSPTWVVSSTASPTVPPGGPTPSPSATNCPSAGCYRRELADSVLPPPSSLLPLSHFRELQATPSPMPTVGNP